MSSFQIQSLDYAPFAHLFALSEEQLNEIGAERRIVNVNPGYPCRVSLIDAQLGEEIILLNYEHHAVPSAYRASGPIFVRKDAAVKQLAAGEVPDCVINRLISIRAYNSAHIMEAANVCKGSVLSEEISLQLENPRVAYLHLHNAKPGCFSCAVRRV